MERKRGDQNEEKINYFYKKEEFKRK